MGGSVKKMPDNTINIEHGKVHHLRPRTTPPSYLAMTKAKVIPGKKVITGPALPGDGGRADLLPRHPRGLLPDQHGPQVGPADAHHGEEYSKGFFLRDLGYYFTLGEYADLAVRGGIYTLGSWEASAASRYIKRQVQRQFQHAVFRMSRRAKRGEYDYIKQSNFRIQWTHSQDPQGQPPVRPSRPR